MSEHYSGHEPSKPEVLTFEPDESALMVGAVSYYVVTRLESYETTWGTNAYIALSHEIPGSLDQINKLTNFVASGNTLATKLAAHHEEPADPVEFTDTELEMLGRSLYHYGNTAFPRAARAVLNRAVTFFNPTDRQSAIAEIQSQRNQAFAIYKKIANYQQVQGKDVPWDVWNQPEPQD